MPIKDPFKELEEMQERMNKLMKNFWERGPRAAGTMRGFPVDVREENGTMVVEADLPGISKENVAVKARDNRLMISAQEEKEEQEESENYYRRERSKRGLKRTVALPEGVKEEEAEAEMEDGVLRVTMPKKEKKEEKSKEIEVE
ncbi:MAG: Hsp20/alpha crystallin family protein [Candidatus Aenigmatarchaeota archaeon]